MAHLSPDTFIDLLDGIVEESSVPHLGACQVCRQQLADLRATFEAAADVPVPEPSPLFWDHLSARIRDAVAAEPVEAKRWWQFDQSWRKAALASAAAALIAVAVVVEVPWRDGTPAPPAPANASQMAETGAAPALEPLAEDESLGFVADLASNVDWDAAGLAGIAATRSDAERAVADLSGGERIELQRLLQEALGQNNAM